MANVKIYKCFPHIFALALTISDIQKLKKNYLKKVGQGHGTQLHHSMANVKIYKCLQHIFALALIISEIKKFQICDLQKVGQGHRV